MNPESLFNFGSGQGVNLKGIVAELASRLIHILEVRQEKRRTQHS
jgi:hypothetical protein